MTQFQPPRGTRDTPPAQMIKRQFVLDAARFVFENWGFDPLDTPAFEDFELLTAKSGEAIKDEIYYFKDKSDRELGLRFDFSVPLARFVASNPNLPKPFRRYQMGPVWRYDRPGADRYREFWQADIDVIGAAGPEADTEIVLCACEVLRKIGLSNFTVRINNRKIISSFLEKLDVDIADVIRSVDKLLKIGENGVKEELKSKNISDSKIGKILEFVGLDTKKAVEYVDGKGLEGIKELETLLVVRSSGFPVKVDMGMVRGLDYYTGNIFEIMREDGLTIAAGGRYDNMIESFGGKPTPATGISLGVDRLVSMIQLDLGGTKVGMYIANVNEATKFNAVDIASQLRAAGVNVEYDIMGRNLAKQLEYVNSKGIKYMIVIGESETKSGVVKLRNMETGNEKEVELRDLQRVKDLVGTD